MTKIKDTSTNFANKKALAEECQEVYAVNIIGGQWTLAICCYLINGKLRFSELKTMPSQYYRKNAGTGIEKAD